MSLEEGHEMFGVLFADVFDAKVIDVEGESDRAPLVGPENGDTFTLGVPLFVEAFFEQFWGH